MSVAESAVIQALTQRAETIAQFADVNTVEDSPALKDLRGQLAGLEAITVIPNRTVNPAISEAIRSLRDEIYRLEQQSQLQGQFDTTNRELLMLVASRPDFWQAQEVSQKQRFFRMLVDHVLMSDGKLLDVFLKV